MEIVLIRHGEPKLKKHVWLTAKQFGSWLVAYDRCKISDTLKPPESLKDRITQYFIVSSQLPRAITSAKMCAGKPPDLVSEQLNEFPIPHRSLPLFVNAYAWIIINGLLWLSGLHGKVESFWQSRKRAKGMAGQLANIAHSKENIAVFGHVIVNYFIAFELVRSGWQVKFSGKTFWSTLTLTSHG